MRTPSPKDQVIFKRFPGGLSLIQMLAVVAIAAVIASWGLSKLSNSMKTEHTPEVAAAYKDIAGIMQGLDKYQKAHGAYPTNQQGLLALVLKPQVSPVPENWKTGGYVQRLPRDPWGNPYQYRQVSDKHVEVFSYAGKHADEVTEDTLIIKASI
jgi:general secretion pathway protein G